MANTKQDKDATSELAPGERTAEEIHAARREGEAASRADSGLDRHGQRENVDETRANAKK